MVTVIIVLLLLVLLFGSLGVFVTKTFLFALLIVILTSVLAARSAGAAAS